MGCVSDIVDVGEKRQKGVNRDYDLSHLIIQLRYALATDPNL